jgi:Fic family protein
MHWDDFRFRPPPAGLTPEQSWGLVKLSRLGDKVFTPIVSTNGRAFSYALPSRAQEALHAVDRMGGALLTNDGSASLEPMREQVVVSALMEEAIATSQIEGAATTRRVAKEMLRNQRKPRDRSEQMIMNSYVTMQFLRKEQARPLSLELLFEIQARMTRDTLDDEGCVGRLRRTSDEIVIVDSENNTLFTPPPADDLSERMAKLVAWANAQTSSADNFIHPLVKAAVLHFWLAYEHPFVDGNGRTARALFYWFMLKSGYWVFEFLNVSRVILKSRVSYYRSFLHAETDDEDMTYSLLYQLDATRKSIAEMRAYLAQKQREQSQMSQSLRAVPDLNHRQRALLDHALKKPHDVVTFQSHQTIQGITYVTARADIQQLLDRGLLEEVTHGRQRAFLPAENLAQLLAKAPKRRAKKN